MAKRTVLISGCSEGSLGAALAIAFHNAGLHVYATARNPSKMKSLEAMGISILTLDVLSASSIAECVKQVPSLDILVNNAGALYAMPVSDMSIDKAKELFDLNVWSYLEVLQAFLPLLIASKGMVVNQTSVSSCTVIPFQSAYNASKAAMAMFSESMRLELQPFGITVIELKTGSVTSTMYDRNKDIKGLPDGSIYLPAKEAVEKAMRNEELEKSLMDQKVWADLTVKDLLKPKPVPVIWRGTNAALVRLSTVLPFGWFDGMLKKMTGLDVVEKAVGGK
ncbi:NAD(P)-binding Rossmann-fold containing protein [Glarea lozoyensis ATCC 20868]|uniref:NAD(P)-binding Rossmann-fold containing protein n=1 Tax=Glarea lozoyensis (strain ATCC 20868 / MF5171) TaxID=1116229 RepID=S3DJW9_GLAL2|nr:NAD(P)-binding Rossmann-fold containing protein [Glarea lozoyensis ATCC 20868]EPE32336.1 NAD(P)-binding Rossmann-fold containing protein [Glarea lozoyensis ATCC 20868]